MKHTTLTYGITIADRNFRLDAEVVPVYGPDRLHLRAVNTFRALALRIQDSHDEQGRCARHTLPKVTVQRARGSVTPKYKVEWHCIAENGYWNWRDGVAIPQTRLAEDRQTA